MGGLSAQTLIAPSCSHVHAESLAEMRLRRLLLAQESGQESLSKSR
jgi:hypothetical protein